MPRFLQRISVEQVQQGEFYQESLLYRRVCSQPRKETHPNRGTWPRVRWRGAACSEHNNSAAQQAGLVHVAKHEASPGSTGALGGSPARLEAPLRAALRRVRLRAKGSAEPAQPARPGPGVTPALPQRLWKGAGSGQARRHLPSPSTGMLWPLATGTAGTPPGPGPPAAAITRCGSGLQLPASPAPRRRRGQPGAGREEPGNGESGKERLGAGKRGAGKRGAGSQAVPAPGAGSRRAVRRAAPPLTPVPRPR